MAGLASSGVEGGVGFFGGFDPAADEVVAVEFTDLRALEKIAECDVGGFVECNVQIAKILLCAFDENLVVFCSIFVC